jgi:undecaprenyl-diphosphatase
MLLLYALFVAVVILRMVYLIRRDGLLPGDLEATLALQSIAAPWFKNLMVAVSTFGWYPWSVLSVLAASLLVTLWLGFKTGLYLAVIVGLQALINFIIKELVARPRPTDPPVWVYRPEAGYAFPSGHVMFYSVFFGFLLFLAWRYLRPGWPRGVVVALLAALILLVGFSRIYLGAHWLSDVVAGYLVGGLVLWAAIEVYPSIPAFAAARTSSDPP